LGAAERVRERFVMQRERRPLDARPVPCEAPIVRLDSEGRYVCPACGELIVVPVDPSAGSEQEYGEDCPVCCVPLLLRVLVDPDGEIAIDARSE